LQQSVVRPTIRARRKGGSMASRVGKLPRIQAIVLSIVLGGCAPAEMIVPPDLESLPDSEVAILKVDKTAEADPRSGGQAALSALLNLNGGQKVFTGGIGYDRVKVMPGDYRVILSVRPKCNCYAYTAIHVPVKGGMTYLFATTTIMDGKAVKAEYREIPTSTDATSNQ
jgi:hypothetical protein